MFPLLYLILIRKNGTLSTQRYRVNLPSSLMIVSSNAFVFSTSLLGLVSRYGINNKKILVSSNSVYSQK